MPVSRASTFENQRRDNLLNVLVPESPFRRHGKYSFFHSSLVSITAFDNVMINYGYVNRLGEIYVGNNTAFNLNYDMIHLFLFSLLFLQHSTAIPHKSTIILLNFFISH